MKQDQVSNFPEKRHAGPNLLVVALVYAVLMLAGGSLLVAAFNIPQGSLKSAQAYIAANVGPIRWGSFFELGSALPLGVLVAAVASRLRFLGVRAAGESIAFLGGSCATIMLMVSSLSLWALTRPGVGDESGAARALQALGYAGGGRGFAVAFGLFAAGVSVSAGLHKLIPRWVMGLGVLVALACELSSLSLLNPLAGYFIPAGRFVGVIWMIAVAALLPKGISTSQS